MEPFENYNIDTDSLVTVEAPRLQSLEPMYLRVIIITRIISLIVLSAILVSGYYLVDSDVRVLLLLLAAPVLILYGIWSIISAVMGFRYKGYALREKDISYQKGWLWRNFTTVAINRVQHVSVDQGFVERQFNLARIKIFTAGGTGSDITIPGLRPEKAEIIKEFIVQRTAHEEEE